MTAIGIETSMYFRRISEKPTPDKGLPKISQSGKILSNKKLPQLNHKNYPNPKSHPVLFAKCSATV